MSGGVFLATADTLARFDGEESRLAAFAEFFHQDPHHPVPDLDEWARQAKERDAPAPGEPAAGPPGATVHQ